MEINNNFKMSPELFNLLTLPFDDNVDEYSVEDILKLINDAAESLT